MGWFDSPLREELLVQEVAQRKRTITANRSQVTPGIARNAAQLAYNAPTIDRELTAAMTLAGVPAGSPMVEQVAMRSWEKDQNLWDMTYSAMKGTTRILGTIAQSFYEELVSRPVRTAVGVMQGQGLSEAYGQAGSSVGVRALGEIAGGRRVNLGSGFLPGNDVATPEDPMVEGLVERGVPEQEAMNTVQARYGRPIWDEFIRDSERIKFRGMPVSPGRLAAGVLPMESGTLPYNVFSGLIDATSQIVFDPTSRLFTGFKIPRAFGLTGELAGKEIQGISSARKNMKLLAGLSDENVLRPSIFKPDINTLLDKRLDGKYLLDALWEHKDDQLSLIKIFTRNGQADPPAALIKAIQNLEDGQRELLPKILKGETGVELPDILGAMRQNPVAGAVSGNLGRAVGSAMQPLQGSSIPTLARMGEGVTPELGRVLGFGATVGHTLDGTALGRVFATMPGRQLHFNNLDQGAGELDKWMVEAKFTYEQRNAFLKRWIDLSGEDLPGPKFYEEIFGDLADTFVDNVVRDVFPKAVVAGGKAAKEAYAAGAAKGDPKKMNFLANELRESFKGMFHEVNELRAYATLDLADMPVIGARTVQMDGETVVQPTAHLLAEYLNRGVPLPDARQVRRAVSHVSTLTSNAALEPRAAFNLMDLYMQKIWKPMVLLRVAFPLRVQADNQLRMAVAGYDSMFRSPLDWISWAIADPTMGGNIQDLLKGVGKATGRKARGETGVLVREVKDESGQVQEVWNVLGTSRLAKDAMSGGSGGFLGFHGQLENVGEVAYIRLPKNADGSLPQGWMDAWATEIGQLAGDEVAQRVAANVDDAKDWFWQQEKIRRQLADTDAKKPLISDEAAAEAGYGTAREASDLYIDSVWVRINQKTGGNVRAELVDGKEIYEVIDPGNAKLIESIALGKHTLPDGNTVSLSAHMTDARWKSYLDDLEARYLDRYSPNAVKAHDPADAHKNIPDAANRVVQRLFQALASKPENVLSRSPAFRQAYWKRVEELIPYMDDALRTQAYRAAENANLKWDDLARMRRAGSAKAGQLTDMQDIDDIAKTFALGQTRDLLYDLQKRSNFMDIARNVFPFGEAWVEVLSRWAKILAEHPEATRRFQQVVEGGRRSGFITTDPVSGQEVFNYPGGGLLSKWMLGGASMAGPVAGMVGGLAAGGALGGVAGAGVGLVGGGVAGALGAGAAAPDQPGASLSLQGQIQGMNLVTASYLPGLGPLVQMPIAGLLSKWGKETTKLDWARDAMFPFGDPEVSLDGFLKMGLPAYSKKILQPMSTNDPQFERLHLNSTVDVMRALLSTGEYSKDSPEALLKLQQDASEMAGNLSIIRGFLQFGLPTGPQVRYYAAPKGEDPAVNAQFYLFQTLATDYRQMLENHNYDDAAAYDEFWVKYGLDPVNYTTSKTTSSKRRGATTPSYNFQRTHETEFELYPLTAYYASPDDPDEDFDLRAWAEQLDEGTRVPFTPEQWTAAANHTKGALQYEEAKRKVEMRRLERGESDAEAYNEKERAYLREMKAYLRETYPGYDEPNVGTPTRPDTEQQIAELMTWHESQVLAQSPAGRGLAVYLAARDRVIREVEQMGYSPTAFQRGKLDGRGVHLRAYLRQTAQWIMTQPGMMDFGPLWQSVLSKELKDEVDEVAA